MIRSQNKTLRLTLISLALMVFIIAILSVGLGKFVTVDEPAWTLFASNFYLALSRGQFEKTAIDYGVTTLWILTLAFLSYFPEYRALGMYTEKYWRVDELLRQYHKSPLALLLRGRLISILATAALIIVSFLLLNLLSGLLTALVVTGMVALDPFFLGHARLLNHEGLMAAGILVSMLAALVYLYPRRQVRYLALSGAAAAVALLAKVPAIALFPLVGLMFLVRLIEERGRARIILRYVAGLGLWVLVVAGVYTLLWPGMWVAPGAMLYEVFGNALSNALQGGRLVSFPGLQAENFTPEFAGIILYLKYIFLKTTPVVWLGGLLAFAGLWVKKSAPMSSINKKLAIYFGLLAILFVLMFGLAKGRNSSHYVLTSFVALDVVAGVGLAWGYGWLAERAPVFQKRAIQVTVLGGLLLLHGLGALPHYPYYYTYANPLAGALLGESQASGVGYGEGLELAAGYLAAKPGAEEMTAISYYALGPFSYFFPGETLTLKTDDRFSPEDLQEFKEADYLVIYTVRQQPRDGSTALLTALESIPPEKTIWLDGVKVASIYAIDQFPESLFTAISE